MAREDRGWRTAVLDLSEGGCALLCPAGFDLHVGAVGDALLPHALRPRAGRRARVARVGERDLGFEYHEAQTVPPSLHRAASGPVTG